MIIASAHDGEKLYFLVEIVFLSDFTLENSLSKNRKHKKNCQLYKTRIHYFMSITYHIYVRMFEFEL